MCGTALTGAVIVLEWLAAEKAPGSYRIVLIGSSVAEGLRVQQKDTFAARLGPTLTQVTGRRVDVYNEGIEMRMPRDIAANFGEVLSAKPDLILWTITPLDVQHGAVLNVPWLTTRDGFVHGSATGHADRDKVSAIYTHVSGKMRAELTTTFLLEHLLYKSQSEYVDHFLMQGSGAEFLRIASGPEWRSRLRQFGCYASEVMQNARRAGIPVVVTAVPQRAQAAMISMGRWPKGYDPYRFGEQLRTIVVSQGAQYVDLLHMMQHVANPEQDYFPVDGHPNSAGHELLAQLLGRELRPDVVQR